METTIYNVTRLMDALDVWGGEMDNEFAAKDELISAAKELIGQVPGITGVYFSEANFASIYLDATFDREGEEESFTVRLSNHKGRPNSHMPPVWSFEPGDNEKSVRLGLAKIEEAAK